MQDAENYINRQREEHKRLADGSNNRLGYDRRDDMNVHEEEIKIEISEHNQSQEEEKEEVKQQQEEDREEIWLIPEEVDNEEMRAELKFQPFQVFNRRADDDQNH